MPSIDVLLYVSLNKLLKQTSPAAGDLKRQDTYVTSLQSRNIPHTGKKTKAGGRYHHEQQQFDRRRSVKYLATERKEMNCFSLVDNMLK